MAGVDPDKDEKWGKHRDDHLAHRPFRNFEFAIKDEDGVSHYRNVSGKPFFDKNGTFRGYRGSVTDINERKRAEKALRDSEAHLRNILDHSPTPIYFKDTKAKFILVNSQYEKNYGVKFEDIKGKTSLEIFPGEQGKQFYDRDMAVLKGQETITREELIDGKTYVTSTFPILADDGTLIGLGCVETDITDRKKTEEILRHSQKMEAVGQLTGGVAHDFNNLLAVITGNLELTAKANGLEDKTKERLLFALKAANKGANLIDQLLTFSRQQTLNPETIDANTQLFDTINLLMRTLGEDIDIKTAFDTPIPLIRVDPGILGNAILNMAINARDAMPKGGTLTIKTTSVDLDGKSLYDD
jgi:PAS domain S-box-containing protein